jgi:hypothetical protein
MAKFRCLKLRQISQQQSRPSPQTSCRLSSGTTTSSTARANIRQKAGRSRSKRESLPSPTCSILWSVTVPTAKRCLLLKRATPCSRARVRTSIPRSSTDSNQLFAGKKWKCPRFWSNATRSVFAGVRKVRWRGDGNTANVAEDLRGRTRVNRQDRSFRHFAHLAFKIRRSLRSRRCGHLMCVYVGRFGPRGLKCNLV